MNLVAAFRPLRLRSGYVLRGYLYTSGEDGNGVIYAMPEGSPFPEPQQCEFADDRFLHPPVPHDAEFRVMTLIEGNGSPRSYLLASVLARELLEFGARRHGRLWSLEQIVGKPSVEMLKEEVVVTFCTQSDRERTRYIDTYAKGHYTFSSDAIRLP